MAQVNLVGGHLLSARLVRSGLALPVTVEKPLEADWPLELAKWLLVVGERRGS